MSGSIESGIVGGDWLMSVDDHYSLTGTYRIEDVIGVLGAPWESFQVSAVPAAPITSAIFSEEPSANSPSTCVTPAR